MNPHSTTLTAMASAETVRAKAYCGAAHGQHWSIDGGRAVPEQVTFSVEGRLHSYRLVHDPRKARPARDHVGNYVYMPASYGAAPSATGPEPFFRAAAPPAVPRRRRLPLRQR